MENAGQSENINYNNHMLVKKSIVEKWYQTDSWVYKNFAYLFKNPLWDNNIPRGFSVCPYFWMNMFSLIIFRPFVVFPMNYFILPLIKWIGWPAVKLDKFLGKLFRLDPEHKGGGIGVAFVGLLLLSAVGLSGYQIARMIVKFYPYMTSTSFGMFTFWSITSFISLWGIIGLHKAITKTECKTISYLWVWLAAFIVSCFVFIRPEFILALSSMWDGISSATVDVCGWIWIGLKYAGWGLWKGVSFTPFPAFYIPWWVYLFTGAAGVWLMDVICIRLESNRRKEFRAQVSENFWYRNRNSWLNLFANTLTQGKCWREGWMFIDNDENIGEKMPTKYFARACSFYRDSIYKKAFEILLGDKLNELQKYYPILNQDKWKKLEKYEVFGDRFTCLPEALDGKYPEFNINKEDFKKAVYAALETPDMREYIERYAAQFERDSMKRRERITAKKTTWSHRMCLLVTGAISNGVKRTGGGIATGGVQVGTFFVYLWMLVKAKKQGACPYFRFTDPQNKPENQP